CQQYNDLVITF
nr:immunoglobulin light chain junction region [Macaca mulatta]MOY12343.1 immunoglobulin light chain junction region [Macaca mulatta]MOY12881.1 immunoglobulin light chain junction region [Macaca mulatta]MOY13781.1 immunoglobulin light chain junction region [Macaca mulatta]